MTEPTTLEERLINIEQAIEALHAFMGLKMAKKPAPIPELTPAPKQPEPGTKPQAYYLSDNPVMQDVFAERYRQKDVEGFSADQDDTYVWGELGAAAACYAMPVRHRDMVFQYLWPNGWDKKWWKPKSRRRDLVRAAALIIAEIERLDRLQNRKVPPKK